MLFVCLFVCFFACLFVCLGSRAGRCWTHCRPSREVSWSPSNARCFPHQSRHHSLPRAADVKSLSRTRTHVTVTTRCSPQETEPVLCFLATAAREREVNITRDHVPPGRSCSHSHARTTLALLLLYFMPFKLLSLARTTLALLQLYFMSFKAEPFTARGTVVRKQLTQESSHVRK